MEISGQMVLLWKLKNSPLEWRNLCKCQLFKTTKLDLKEFSFHNIIESFTSVILDIHDPKKTGRFPAVLLFTIQNW